MTDKPLVIVKWHDAEDFVDTPWVLESDLKDFNEQPCVVYSVGYVVKKTRSHVTLASDLIAPDTWGSVRKIPKKMIVEVLPVKVEKQPQEEPLKVAALE